MEKFIAIVIVTAIGSFIGHLWAYWRAPLLLDQWIASEKAKPAKGRRLGDK